jgi:hypothetical protein
VFGRACAPFAMVPDVKGHQPCSDEAQDEASRAPFQSNSEGMAQQNYHHGHGDDANDEGMGAETFH